MSGAAVADIAVMAFASGVVVGCLLIYCAICRARGSHD